MVERVGGHGIRSVFYSLLIMDLELQMLHFNATRLNVFPPCGLGTICFCTLIIMEHNMIKVSLNNAFLCIRCTTMVNVINNIKLVN